MREFRINLGDKVSAVSSGFVGMVTARTECLTSVNIYRVQPESLNNEFKPAVWFDEDNLDIVLSKSN